mmetsp:Transcript_70174/g.196673  ORF Transcript_70174/g.196673 Transcript_70174/m.196673 type:complete len:234 (+) Transcript_70174:82-783(+)
MQPRRLAVVATVAVAAGFAAEGVGAVPTWRSGPLEESECSLPPVDDNSVDESSLLQALLSAHSAGAVNSQAVGSSATAFVPSPAPLPWGSPAPAQASSLKAKSAEELEELKDIAQALASGEPVSENKDTTTTTPVTTTTTTTTTLEMLSPLASSEITDELKKARAKAQLDCIVAEWSEWSVCTTFKNGMKGAQQLRTRSVVQPQKPGGNRCPVAFNQYRSCANEGAIAYMVDG